MSLGAPMAHAAPLMHDEALLRASLSTTTVRTAIEHEFGTSSIMVHVARCESEFKQFGDDGKVLQGE